MAEGTRRCLKTLNDLYDKALRLALYIALGIVFWCIYDAAYVYSHTLDKDILKYKPDPYGDNTAALDSPITDDMVSWLTIDDTNIDYPVMQGRDNTEYLNKDPFGEYSLSGSIFLDSRCSPDFTDDYSLVYGHHMEYGKMFGALDEFLDSSYLSAHSTGTLIIGKDAHAVYPLKVFAALNVNARDNEVFSPSESLETRKYLAARLGEEPEDKRILALSTCSEGDSLARIVVFCYILDEQKQKNAN